MVGSTATFVTGSGVDDRKQHSVEQTGGGGVLKVNTLTNIAF